MSRARASVRGWHRRCQVQAGVRAEAGKGPERGRLCRPRPGVLSLQGGLCGFLSKGCPCKVGSGEEFLAVVWREGGSIVNQTFDVESGVPGPARFDRLLSVRLGNSLTPYEIPLSRL